MTKGKVLVAMSGGVDSSVAAAMLKRDGYDVVGCFMRLGSPGESLDEMVEEGEACAPERGAKIGKQGCCSILDAADARLVAARLDVPLYVCNFKKEFGRVIDYFVDEYARGRTPNPCVRCNDWLKFGKLHEYAAQVGAGWVASGHYARIIESGGGTRRLARGKDAAKDQSYVLFGIPEAQLARTMFPIGDLPKARVRELAREWDLPVFDKPDSQEICFVPDNDYAGLVERRRPELMGEGNLVDGEGAVVGKHSGQHRFTVGQRRGVPLATGSPVYVLSRDPVTNTVRIGAREDLAVGACEVSEMNWLGEAPPGEAEYEVQYRAHARTCRGRVRVMGEGAVATPSGRVGRARVEFVEPQEAVAPGQALVMYDGDEVVGGGWIERTIPAGE